MTRKGRAAPWHTTISPTQETKPGELVEVLATDAGSVADFTAWSKATGNQLLEHTSEGGVYRFVIRKG